VVEGVIGVGLMAVIAGEAIMIFRGRWRAPGADIGFAEGHGGDSGCPGGGDVGGGGDLGGGGGDCG
jgi:hypothetical protein